MRSTPGKIIVVVELGLNVSLLNPNTEEKGQSLLNAHITKIFKIREMSTRPKVTQYKTHYMADIPMHV